MDSWDLLVEAHSHPGIYLAGGSGTGDFRKPRCVRQPSTQPREREGTRGICSDQALTTSDAGDCLASQGRIFMRLCLLAVPGQPKILFVD